jgi:hypothetical protein
MIVMGKSDNLNIDSSLTIESLVTTSILDWFSP